MTNPSDAAITAAEVVSEIKKHVLIGGFGLVFDQPRSHGSHFHDAASGRTMLDMYGFFGSLPLGFNHPYFDRPEVRKDLLQAALTKVSNSDVYTAQYARFVRTFERVVGIPQLDRLFLIDGGTLAVENALKAAMDWKVRKNIAAGRGEFGTDVLHLRLSFHGRSGYTLSLTNTDPNKTMYFAQFDWPRVTSPAIDFALPTAQRLEKAAADERAAEAEIMAAIAARPHRICAIILEPIQCEGGDRHFRAEWFQTLRRICDQNEMMLIFDEVQCGMCTTGRNWCCQHFGVLPDMLAFGKKAAVCGVMAASKRLDEVPENVFRKPGRINSTWGSNLTDMVRSIHCMAVIEQENLVENARIMGERFLGQLQRIAAEEPLITAPRGRGLLLAFDLPDTATRDRFWRSCYEVGLMINRCGGKSIRLRPVLDVKPEAVDEAVSLLRQAIRLVKAP
ncbi:MAG TPA: L-lysine 6-transaminase [Phycisphaerae bacterium]|nr:L-lysine 6-transaminase [Phycisphaerae bacterium]